MPGDSIVGKPLVNVEETMTSDGINLQQIYQSQTPPPLFEGGAPMWNDPHIATQMLSFHLNESHDIASLRPETIDKIVTWIAERLDLRVDMSLLDLGCGPGLYTRRFAEKGLQVTGIDYSRNSIDYARRHDSTTTYICQNYVAMDLPDQSFDAVIMIYGDFCVLDDEERDSLLAKTRRMLKPDGAFVFDVTKPQMHQYLENYRHWSVAPSGGFWKPDSYLVLEQGFAYPDDITVQQYVVIEADGTQTHYRNWYHDYTPETLSPVLEQASYDILEMRSDLMGTPYSDDSNWCGIIAKKSV